MRVVLSVNALAELEDIWFYNAREYDTTHADAYMDFLKGEIYGLATNYEQGRPLTMRPELRRVTIRKGKRGHGHIAVYRVEAATIYVLHVFHTRQDLEGRLEDEAE